MLKFQENVSCFGMICWFHLNLSCILLYGTLNRFQGYTLPFCQMDSDTPPCDAQDSHMEENASSLAKSPECIRIKHNKSC